MNPNHLLPLVGGNVGRAITLEQLMFHSRRNGGGEFHVDLDFIARFTKTSRMSVSRYVKWLAAEGFIRTRQEKHYRGYGVVLYFRVLVRLKEGALSRLRVAWEAVRDKVLPRAKSDACSPVSTGVTYNSINYKNSKKLNLYPPTGGNAAPAAQECSASPKPTELRSGKGETLSGRGDFQGKEERGARVRRKDLPENNLNSRSKVEKPKGLSLGGLKPGGPEKAAEAVAAKEEELHASLKHKRPTPLAAARVWRKALAAYGDEPFPLEDKKHLAHVRTTLSLVQADTLERFEQKLGDLISQYAVIRSTVPAYKKVPAHPWAINRHLKAGHISATGKPKPVQNVTPSLTNPVKVQETTPKASPAPKPQKEKKLTILEMLKAKAKKEKGPE